MLAQGIQIPLASIGSALFFKIVLYTGLMGLFGAWVFSKREIALPST